MLRPCIATVASMIIVAAASAPAHAATYCADFHTWDQYPPHASGPAGTSARVVVEDWDPDAIPGHGSFKVTLWVWESDDVHGDDWSYIRERASVTVRSRPTGPNDPPEARASVSTNDSRFVGVFADEYTVRILAQDTHADPPWFQHKGDVIYDATFRGRSTGPIPMGNMLHAACNEKWCAHSGFTCPRTIVHLAPPQLKRTGPLQTPAQGPPPPEVCQQHPEAKGCSLASEPSLPPVTIETPSGTTCWNGIVIQFGICATRPEQYCVEHPYAEGCPRAPPR